MAAPALRVVEAHARAYRHVWKGSVVTSFLNPLLFLLALGVGVGSLVSRNEPASLGGLSYLEFVATGLLAANAMQTAATDSSWPVMSAIKWQKTYRAALATPVAPRDLAVGHLGWSALRLAFTSAVFALVLVALGIVTPLRAAASVTPAVLTGLAFAAPIAALAASLQRDYALSSLFRFGILPMFLLSGTFFPIAQLPAWLQPLAAIVPLWHGVQLTRVAALGEPTAFPVGVHTAYLLVWFLVGALLAARQFHRRLIT